MKEQEKIFQSLQMNKKKIDMETIQFKIKTCFFSLLYVLLKNQDISLCLEIIYIFIQILQLLSFSFNPIFEKSWKQTNFFTNLSSILQYFNLIHFFEEKREMYMIMFYFFFIFVILISFNVAYVSFSLLNNRINAIWTLPLLRIILPLITGVLFIPTLIMLFSMLSCNQSVNNYISTMTCWSGLHALHSVFAILGIIIFIPLSILIQMTYFETKFNVHNPKAKSTARADFGLLIIKLVYVVIFIFLDHDEQNKYFLYVIIFCPAVYLTYIFWELQPYYNRITMKLNKGLCLIFLWSTTALAISAIFEMTQFNGGIAMFFLGIPVIILIIMTDNNDVIGILLTNMSKFKKGEIALSQIRYVLDIIDRKDNERHAKILLKGYIFQYETNCMVLDCPLKKYIAALTNNCDSIVFLLQHVELMYQIAIAKFPLDTELRISFAFFLLERMNKKQQASLELKNTENHSPKFEEEFIIYRYKRLLEEQITDLGDIEDNLDTVSNLEYKNHFTLFKSAIGKASGLYLDFWSLLLSPNKDSQEDLTKLNDYGSKINILVEEIRNNFDKMQKLKHNDPDVIRYYSDFLNDILNDKEKSQHYKSRLNQLEDPKQSYDDANLLFSLDINSLSTNDEYQYIIVSAQPDKFGIINNFSMGLCSIFGYSKSELIGKMIEVIMPEIFHKSHRNILLEKLNEFKKNSIDITDIKNYKPQFKEITTFGRNKSRYLVQITMKVALIPTEDNDLAFVGKLWQNLSSITNSSYQTCYIITNNLLTIQNFTANAVNLLGMNSNAINSTVDITECIKQFNEELLKYVVDNEEKTCEQKLQLKRNILSRKYRNPALITWKRCDEKFDTKVKTKLDMNTSQVSYDDYSYNEICSTKMIKQSKHSMDDIFVLTVQDAMIRNIQEGYIFKFETQSYRTKGKSISSINKSQGKFTSYDRIGSSQNINYKKETSYNELPQTKYKTASKLFSFEQQIEEAPSSSVFQIDKSYLPEVPFNFQLDPNKLAFKPSDNIKVSNVTQYLKNQAIKKINQATTQNSNNSNSSSNDDDNSVTSSGYASEQSSCDIDNESFHSYLEPKKEPILVKSKDEYFKVNVTNIKFSEFDFTRGLPIEIKDYDRTDQVQLKMADKTKETITESKLETKEGKATTALENDNVDNIESHEKGNLIIKQIEYALAKEETQPTIIKMKWFSFIVCLLLLSCGGALIGVILDSFCYLFENVQLIQKAYNLLEYNSYGIYYIKELILLNNENYTMIPYNNRTTYIAHCFNQSLEIFITSHDLISEIITSFLPLSNKNRIILSNTSIDTSIIEDDYSIVSFQLALTSAFIETNTALFHIGHSDITKTIPTNKDVFFYLYNSINQLVEGHIIQANIYFDQYQYQLYNTNIYLMCLYIGTILILIVIFILMSSAYNGIVKRKESYLEVFFEIGNSVIKASLEKCENFIKKMQSDYLSDIMSSSYDHENEEDNVLMSNEIKKDYNRSKGPNKTSKETHIFKMKMVFYLCIVALFSFLVSMFYMLYLKDMGQYMKFYKNKIEQENHYLLLFNTLREYIFEPNSKVMNQPSKEYLNNLLENFYNVTNPKQKELERILKKIPRNYHQKYNEIYKNSICNNLSTSSIEDFNCQTFMSNSSSLGLEVMLSYFVEEIRFMKNKANEHIDEQKKYPKFKINLTLTNTEEGKQNWPKDPAELIIYKEIDQINVFNNDKVHLKLNIMHSQLILPNFFFLSQLFKAAITHSLEMTQLINIIVISCFLGLVIIGYLFFWMPFAEQLNQTIYKTKNMLSIIPKEVLASLSNINKLLDIGQNMINNPKRVVVNHQEKH